MLDRMLDAMLDRMLDRIVMGRGRCGRPALFTASLVFLQHVGRDRQAPHFGELVAGEHGSVVTRARVGLDTLLGFVSPVSHAV